MAATIIERTPGGTAASVPSEDDRLAILRMHPEVVAATMLMAVAAICLVVALLHLSAVDPGEVCLRRLAEGVRARCPDAWRLRGIVDGEVRTLWRALPSLPIVVGALLGAPIVARSIEAGRFAVDWATPPARVVRLVGRSWRRAGLAVLGLSILGWLAAEVQWQTTPWQQPGAAPMDTLGTWGPLVVARGLLVLVVGMLLGTIIGHRLAAGVATVAVAALLVFGGAHLVRLAWIDQQAGVVRESLAPGPGAVLATKERGYRNQYGRVAGEDEAARIARHQLAGRVTDERIDRWLADRYEVIDLVVPTSALPDLERTELLATLGATAVVAALAGVTVSLRRPRR